MRDLLVTKLRAVLDGEDPTRIPEDPRLANICAQQREIKWDQLMKGRFATAWASHPNTQIGTNQHQNWTTEVIDFIFTQWWHLWELQNQDRHGRDLAAQQQAIAIQVDRELTMFYEDYTNHAPQHLKWLFDTPIEVRQQWTTHTTRQWLNTWKPLLHKELIPEAAPTNPENYPYTTALETG